MLHALAIALAAIAAVSMIVAIAGMVTGTPSAKAGGWIRVLALGCFAAAVVLNIVAH